MTQPTSTLPTAFSKARTMPLLKTRLSGLGLLVMVLVIASGCGSADLGGASITKSISSRPVLSTEAAEGLLRRLPYRYRWRDVELPQGASGALAGTAIGRHRTIVHFGISLGAEPEAVPVPQAGTLSPYYYYGGGFVFNDDLVLPKGVGKQFHTAAQWDEATTMVVEMQEKLCKAATGEACPP